MPRVCTSCQRQFDEEEVAVCPDDGTELRAVLLDYLGTEDDIRGKVLDGRYLCEEVLGEGGMGVVLRAHHVFLDRKVAIKLLHPELLLVKETRMRFLREARTASTVRHPNVVEISDFGVTERGMHYLVMELLEGDDLLGYLRGYIAPDAFFAARIGAQVCDALGALHEHGFVHRDLKPENIHCLAGSEGETGSPDIKLLDFGIAGIIASGGPGAEARLTQTGRTLGTAHYMAPEQARGSELDGRADLYALGCVLWEVVAGRPAFTGTNPAEIMTKQLYDDPGPPSKVNPVVPPWFDAIVDRALAKERGERFADAAEMKAAIEAALADHGAGSPPGLDKRLSSTEVDVRPSRAQALSGETVVDGPPAMMEPAPAPVPSAEAPATVPGRAARPRESPWLLPLLLVAGALAVVYFAAVSEGPPSDDGAHGTIVEKTVTLQLSVEPAGSLVKRDGEVVGETPLTLDVPLDQRKRAYVFEHPGYRPRLKEIVHDKDRDIELRLEREE